jgi:hypothetical protein
MKRVPTIAVHAFDDERVHLAPARLGHLRQGRLRTLCGRMAVTALSPFAAAGTAATRCRTCFGKVDADGMAAAETAPPGPAAKARPAPKPARAKPPAKTAPEVAPAKAAATKPRREPARRAVARSTARRPLKRSR